MIKSTGGSRKISVRTNVYSILLKEFVKLFEQTTNRNYPIRQIRISFGDVKDEEFEYYDLFTDQQEVEEEKDYRMLSMKLNISMVRIVYLNV